MSAARPPVAHDSATGNNILVIEDATCPGGAAR